MKEKYLDNVTGQEIRELIENEEIALEELDISALNKLLDFETDMLCIGMGDMELIEKCVALLEFSEREPLLTEARFTQIIENTEAEHITIIETQKFENPKNQNEKFRKRSIRKSWLVAAMITILMIGSVIIATAFGFDISKFLKEIVAKPAGTEISVDKHTFYNSGETTVYFSVEEFAEQEDIKILYPTELPEEIEVEKIRKSDDKENSDFILITTTNDRIKISILTNHEAPENNGYKDCERYYRDDCLFYIQKDMCYAFCYYQNDYYYIQADNYENLILIIDNLTEY